jgi:hypothetical protein
MKSLRPARQTELQLLSPSPAGGQRPRSTTDTSRPPRRCSAGGVWGAERHRSRNSTHFWSGGSMVPLVDEEKGRARTAQSERPRASSGVGSAGRQSRNSARPVSGQRSVAVQSGSAQRSAWLRHCHSSECGGVSDLVVAAAGQRTASAAAGGRASRIRGWLRRAEDGGWSASDGEGRDGGSEMTTAR